MSNKIATYDKIKQGLKKRRRSESRFRSIGIASISVGLLFIAILFISVTSKGYNAFTQTMIQIDVFFDPDVLDPNGSNKLESIARGDYRAVTRRTLSNTFKDVSSRRDKRQLYKILSSGAQFQIRDTALKNLSVIGTTIPVWVTASDDVDMMIKGVVDRKARPRVRRLSEKQMSWIRALESQGKVERQFNTTFFFGGDSREPELAGIAVALVGTILSILICLALAVPFGVMAAVYLEEFAPKNRWTTLLEININNLAAVPSIVFGLLGLSVLLNVFELPRSSPLVGGMVLALMTLPTIIITGRSALMAVPPSIREAALAIGASRVQTVFHHVLPLAMPGVLTGTIIGSARALGETAPLLMIGMVAFIVDIPNSLTAPATALPIQVFLWADQPERAFGERTAAAILVLLIFTCLMNLAAVFLRRKFETRW
jgi:phosphate transport system permease protein